MIKILKDNKNIILNFLKKLKKKWNKKKNLNLQLYNTIILTYAEPINSINWNSKKIIYGTIDLVIII